jgi:CelD/BcsL family acetyltransferase involved in cellulose biosynthesis
MDIRVIKTSLDLAAIRDEWNRLPTPSPMTSSRWLLTWWEEIGRHSPNPGSRNTPFVLAAYDDQQQLIGLAPWYLRTNAARRRTILNLGSGVVSSDHQSILCHQDCRPQVVEAMTQQLLGPLSNAWDELDLDGIDSDDPCMRDFMNQLNSSSDHYCLSKSNLSTWNVTLPADWDTLLAGYSRNHRKRLRQMERVYIDSGRAQFNVIESPDQLDAGYKTWFDLHCLRHQALGQYSAIRESTSVQRFHRQVMQTLLDAGQLRLMITHIDGRPAAAEYSLFDGHTLYGYQSGISPEMTEHSPGVISQMLAIKLAIKLGCQKYDFLRGDEAYKKSWHPSANPQIRLRLRRKNLHGTAAHVTQVALSNIKKMIDALQASS